MDMTLPLHSLVYELEQAVGLREQGAASPGDPGLIPTWLSQRVDASCFHGYSTQLLII